MSSWFFSLAIVLALIGALSGPLRFWNDFETSLTLPHTWLYLICIALLTFALISSRLKLRSLKMSPHVFGLGMLVIFFSNWLIHNYNFFQGPTIRGEIILLGCISVYCIPRWSARAWQYVLLLTIAMLFLSFFAHTNLNAALLYSDDNPTFLFRLMLLKKNFPFIPFYYPLWNAGIDARDFFATGALNVFLLASPLIYLFPLESVYNFIVASILFILLPLSMWRAARVAGASPIASSIAVLLALSNSLVWYRWGLKYGTLGFITTAALVPFNLSLLTKFIAPGGQISRSEALLLIGSVTLMLFWVLSGVVFLPLAGIALILLLKNPVQFIKKKYLVLIAAGLLVINVPWLTVLWNVSKVHTFISLDAGGHSMETEPSNPEPAFRHKDSGVNLKKAKKTLRDTIISTNPLIFLLAIPGIFLLPGFWRIAFGTTCIWLLFLGTICVTLKPQFELDRMLLLMMLCLCVPSAMAIETIFQKSSELVVRGQKIARFFVGGFLLCGPFVAATILLNRSIEHFSFVNKELPEFTAVIEKHHNNGRILFSGFVLHEFNEGHIAPLSELTNVPLVASSPFHNKWRYEQVIPASFMDSGESGKRAYFDALNVSAVFAHEREWREYFSNRPDEYERVWSGSGFSLFKRLRFDSNYFYKGNGMVVNQNSNSIVVRVDSPEVILKFNYFPFLRSSACILSASPISPEIQFIKLSQCTPGSTVTIDSVSVWERVLK